jgi:hypothetical protein
MHGDQARHRFWIHPQAAMPLRAALDCAALLVLVCRSERPLCVAELPLCTQIKRQPGFDRAPAAQRTQSPFSLHSGAAHYVSGDAWPAV